LRRGLFVHRAERVSNLVPSRTLDAAEAERHQLPSALTTDGRAATRPTNEADVVVLAVAGPEPIGRRVVVFIHHGADAARRNLARGRKVEGGVDLVRHDAVHPSEVDVAATCALHDVATLACLEPRRPRQPSAG